MTSPPQQPGTGGWGQPSDNGFPQQDPAQAPQQQPAWYGNQHTELGSDQQATQYISPAAAGFGGNPQQAATPPWEGGQFPPTGGWVSEPDGFAAVEPPQRKSKMPWILGGVGGVVVLGGAAVGWLMTAFVYRLPLFGPAILIGSLAFLTAAEWRRILGWLPGTTGAPGETRPRRKEAVAVASRAH